MAVTGTLFNIQRFSTEDGPGIRTTLFFKGCPLVCPWCHNPEGMDSAPRILWQSVHCIGCGGCVEVCPSGAAGCESRGGQQGVDGCTLCGDCVEECPANARELVGKAWTVDALLDEVLRDQAFYESSGGGVTVSGGEPLLQPAFLREFLPRCRDAGLHVALDTSGCTGPTILREFLGMVDLVLFDLKVIEDQAHRELVGVPWQTVRRSLDALVASGLPVWARTPVIPGMTDGDDNIRAIATLLAKHVPTLARYDLLAFSNLCTSKYDMLGRDFALANQPLLAGERMEALVSVAREAGVDCVQWSGLTR